MHMKRREKIVSWGQRESYAYRLIAPSILVLLAVLVVPLLFSLYMSFHKWNLIGDVSRDFYGIRNYIRVLRNPEVIHSLKVTAIFVIAGVGLEFALGMAIALMLNRPFYGYNVVRVIMMLPMMISPAIIALGWRVILDPTKGIVNYLFYLMGLPMQTWLSTEAALVVLIGIEVWMHTPFVVLMILAGLQAIPEEVSEAALIDGANWWQRFTRVIVPMIQPVIMVALIFRTMFALRNFPLPWVLTSGGPANATNVFGIELYRQAFSYYYLGMASAMSWILVFITAFMSIFYFRLTFRESVAY
jgi:multiple sugar transport system permease protein